MEFAYRSQLKGIEIPNDLIALTIDEFPIIFIAAACAKGDTILKGAAELRVKEKKRPFGSNIRWVYAIES